MRLVGRHTLGVSRLWLIRSGGKIRCQSVGRGEDTHREEAQRKGVGEFSETSHLFNITGLPMNVA